ncbi:hypothetical protein [Halocatena halophila]|uniref:hypothetical protein n=1 Tax=Halocatena halophila TaxID=2814576 RepID=UPI002ED409F1
MKDSKRNVNVNRRSVLKSIGAFGASITTASSLGPLADIEVVGTATATDTANNRTITIESANTASYDFTVTGLLSIKDAPEKAVKDGGKARGTVRNGEHSFEFTGEFTSFELRGDAIVRVDGRKFDPTTFPHNKLEIIPNEPVSFDISSSGTIRVDHGIGQRRGENSITASGNNSKSVISYSGELTHLEIDGDARIINNDVNIESDVSLPLTNHGTATISARTTDEIPYTLTLNQDATVKTNKSHIDTIQDGVIDGVATKRETKLTYAGPFTALEIPSVGRVNQPLQSQRVECVAESQEGTRFILKYLDKNEGVKKNHSIKVPDGERKMVDIGGDLTEIIVSPVGENYGGGISVSLNPPTNKKRLEKSKRLKMAAEIQQAEEFAILKEMASQHGRVRRDAQGLFGITTVIDGGETQTTRKVIGFKLTELKRGDRGLLTVVKEDGTVIDGSITYEYITNDGYTKRLEIDQLDDSQRMNALAAPREHTKMESNEFVKEYEVNKSTAPPAYSKSVTAATITFDVERFRKRAGHPSTKNEIVAYGWLPDLPSIGDIWNSITDFGNDVVGAVNGVSWNDLEKTSKGLLITSHTAKFKIAKQYLKDGTKFPKGWNIRLKGVSTLPTLASTEFVQGLAGNDGNVDSCSGCAALARVLWDVGVCGIGGKAVCGAIGLGSGGVGAVGCAVFVSTLCNMANNRDNAHMVCSNTANLC